MQLRRTFDSLSPTNDARRLFDSRELLIGCVSNFPRRFSVHADLHDATCSLSSRRAQRHRRDARSRWDETNAFRCINVRNRTNLFVTHTHTRTSTERNFFFFLFFLFVLWSTMHGPLDKNLQPRDLFKFPASLASSLTSRYSTIYLTPSFSSLTSRVEFASRERNEACYVRGDYELNRGNAWLKVSIVRLDQSRCKEV